MKKIVLAMAMLAWIPSHTLAAPPSKPVIYYANKALPKDFDPYDLVVLDSTNHPPLAPLLESGKMVLGYISLGEAEKYRPYFGQLKKEGLLLDRNKNWNSYMIDVRNPVWTKIVIEQLIPPILSQGFNGLFLDTLDNPPELERSNPGKYHGMTEAAASLVKAIRLHYPQITIMLNRAYPLLPMVGDDINMELGESVYADYNFGKKSYEHVNKADYEEQVKLLKDAQKASPNLVVYTLDYWNPKDYKPIAEIYKTERANGFIPYVATVALDQIVHEPEAK